MKQEAEILSVEKNKDLLNNNTGDLKRDEHDRNETNDNNSTKRYTSSQWITLAVLASSNFCLASCTALQPPLFPREAESKGLTATENGLIFSVFEVAVFIGALITGKLIAHVQPKFILNLGLLTVGVTYIVMGTLDSVPSRSPFFALAFAVRIIEGFGSSAIKISIYSILASQFRESTSTNFGLLETCRGLGNVIGAVVGGSLYDVGGYGLPFYVIGTLTLFDAAVVFFVLPRSEQRKRRDTNFFKFWLNPGILIYFFAISTALNYAGFLNANLERHLRQFNLSGASLGLVFSLLGFLYAGSSGLWGWLNGKKLGSKRLIFIASCLMLISETLIGPLPFFKMAPIFGLIIFSMILTGLGAGGKVVCSFAGALEDTISRGFPRNFNTYGLVSSAFITAESLGAVAGPSLGGYLVDNFGYRMATVVLVGVEILLLVTLAVYICIGKSHESNAEDEEKKPILRDKSPSSTYC